MEKHDFIAEMWRKAKRKYYLFRRKGKHYPLWCRLNRIECGENVRFVGKPFVKNDGEINIGNGTVINSADWANPIGGMNRTYFQTTKDGKLVIGNNVGISNSAITCAVGVTIEDNVLIGADCKIYDTDFHPLNSVYRYGEHRDDKHIKKKSIIIKQGAFVGGGSVVLKGSIIGRNSIIGAGSIVSGIIPDGEIWGGAPARFIKKVSDITGAEETI